MLYFLVLILGIFGGAIAVYASSEVKRTTLQAQKKRQTEQQRQIEELARANTESSALLRRERETFDAQKILYSDLEIENKILKRDLQNIDVHSRKLELDRGLQRESEQLLVEQINDLGKRFLKDNVKWIIQSVKANNFANCKERLLRVIEWCREIRLEVSVEEETALVRELKREFEREVRLEMQREEQAQIKAKLREEALREKEVARLEREQFAIRTALEKALREAHDEYSAEVDRLKLQLEQNQRAISQAQLTKAGHVYVISNIGSFGESTFKIGMSRRLNPKERIDELSSASVPFPFDVHMMISTENAPTLESALHRALHKSRINWAAPRKEFFKTDIETIRRIVEAHHGIVEYQAEPEALEYRQSLTMSKEDKEYIESIYESMDTDDEDSTMTDAA